MCVANNAWTDRFVRNVAGSCDSRTSRRSDLRPTELYYCDHANFRRGSNTSATNIVGNNVVKQGGEYVCCNRPPKYITLHLTFRLVATSDQLLRPIMQNSVCWQTRNVLTYSAKHICVYWLNPKRWWWDILISDKISVDCALVEKTSSADKPTIYVNQGSFILVSYKRHSQNSKQILAFPSESYI
jgi:hypothetical protein